jgi:hypothetical protein
VRVAESPAATEWHLRRAAVCQDLEDLGSNFDGTPDREFRLASKALEQCGLR